MAVATLGMMKIIINITGLHKIIVLKNTATRWPSLRVGSMVETEAQSSPLGELGERVKTKSYKGTCDFCLQILHLCNP